MRVPRLHRCFTASALLGMMALASGCAAKVTEHVYVAPTDQTVTARLEAAMDGKGQYVFRYSFTWEAENAAPVISQP
ncbi:MAG: hypothetical protein M3P24_10685 [Gemmatimonadota bacterium]|nr:hypothetical protein [Gemmatimonadota bacterium]